MRADTGQLHFTATTVAPRSDIGKNVSVEEKGTSLAFTLTQYIDSRFSGNMVHIYRPSATNDLAFVSITDPEYPALAVHDLLRRMCDEFRARYPRTAYCDHNEESPPLAYPELKDYIAKYQNPEDADNILKIKKELDETTIVMKKAIDSMMERGEKIDDLVAKSDGLSAQSKMFYTQVRFLLLGIMRLETLTALCRPRSRTLAASSCKYETRRLDCCTAFTFGYVFERRYVNSAYPMNMSHSPYIRMRFFRSVIISQFLCVRNILLTCYHGAHVMILTFRNRI